jgi:glycosyltransferase involved in cell wall biosynthesis
MKILYDARVLEDRMHGIARYAGNLLRQLLIMDQENEYHVLIRHPEIRALFPAARQVEWLTLPVPPYTIQEQVLLPFQLRRVDFDCYHSPTYSIPLVFSRKGLVTIHDLIHLLFPGDYGLLHRVYYRGLLRPILSQARRVFTVSENSKKDLIRLLNCREGKITVTPNGLEPDWKPRPADDQFRKRLGVEGSYLLFVGNPRPHKNFQRVLEAYQRLIQEDGYAGKLVAIGIESLSLPESLRDRVMVLSHCNDQDLIQFYSGAELLLAPSLYEGFGLPVLEAMACGCPVLVADRGALPEVAGEAGLQVDPYQVSEIVAGLKRILHDAARRRTMQEQGIQQAALFSWSNTARIILDTYRHLYDGNR